MLIYVYNSVEYSDNYSKASGILWQYNRDEPCLNDNCVPANSASFKFKQKITGETGAHSTKDVNIMVPLKYLTNFWRTFEMSLINCKINLILTWSANCIISNATANQATTFTKTDTKLYVPIVTLSTPDNAKLLQQSKAGFKKTISWSKYQSKVTMPG